MERDVVGRHAPITQVRSAEEGLLVSLNQHGCVYPDYIATLYGKPEEQVIEELGDLIFNDPQTGKWETADAYLSGNVRDKLAAARRAGPELARNVRSLEAVQPEDVLPGDIDANLGAPWIPASDIQAFAAELFKVSPSSVPVSHLKKDAVWSLESGSRLRRQGLGRRHFRLRHAAGQRQLAARTGAEHEVADHLRHHRPRRPRGARRQPGRDDGRPRETEAHQGAVPRLGLFRSRPHRAVGSHL